MIFKFKTSKKTLDIFNNLGNCLSLSNITLSKLAIAVSIQCGEPLNTSEFQTDSNGLELIRHHITGGHDTMYKSLIEMFENKYLEDDVYVQTYLKAHIDRGAILLSNYYKYNGNFYLNLLNLNNML